MPKKKDKSKGKGEKGGKIKKKTNGENGEKKPKGPTEQELFEMQIEQMKLELKEAEDILQQHTEALEQVRNLLDTEEKSKISCIAHLKRVLQAEYDRRMDFQDRLQTERDLAELVERRAMGRFAISDRSSEAAKSVFLQQKMELEGKLSLEKDLLLERNSQRTHLKKVEDALNEKISALREKSREEDMKQVDKLLKNREIFLKMCHGIRAEWQAAFKLRLPVQAKRQLEENVRLRDVCEKTTEHLLEVQDENRTLKQMQKSLDLEEEIQSSIEENLEQRGIYQEKRLQRLLLISRDLQSASKQIEEIPFSCPTHKDTEVTEEGISVLEGRGQDIHSQENAVECKITSIMEYDIERCRLQDKLRELDGISEDQMDYRNCLQSDIEANIDRNGAMISAILRAGKIFQTRCGKLRQENMDFDTLHQIRILLDIPANSNSN